MFAWRSGILRRCTSGQSLSAHAGIPRLLVPPSARSQIGDIRPGNDVSARASVNAAPRSAPRVSPGTSEPPALGQAPSRAALCRGTPRAAGTAPASPTGSGAETRGKGSPGPGERRALPRARRQRSPAGCAGPPAGSERAGSSGGTAARPARVRRPGQRVRRLGARHGRARAERLGNSRHGPGTGARAAPVRAGGCCLKPRVKDEGRRPGRTRPLRGWRGRGPCPGGRRRSGAGAGAAAAASGAAPARAGSGARRWSGEQPAPSAVPARRRQRLR